MLDGHSSGTSLTACLTRPTRAAERECSCFHGFPHETGRPYSVLLPVGFTLPTLSPGLRCALTAPFHPYHRRPKARPAVCFLWHFPWGRPRRPLAGTVFPWSPDFPPPGFNAWQRPSNRLDLRSLAPFQPARSTRARTAAALPAVSASASPLKCPGKKCR